MKAKTHRDDYSEAQYCNLKREIPQRDGTPKR